MMIDAALHAQLDGFLAQPDHNRWLHGRFLKVYLRKNKRWLSGQPPNNVVEWRTHAVNCVDFANMADMHPKHQLQGIFSGFFDYLENKHLAIYVELVGPFQLQWYFDRRGYVREPGVNNCYYRLAS